jgi:hypothetical protein
VLVGFHSSVVRAETKTITSLIMHDSGALKAAHLGIAHSLRSTKQLHLLPRFYARGVALWPLLLRLIST